MGSPSLSSPLNSRPNWTFLEERVETRLANFVGSQSNIRPNWTFLEERVET